VQTAFPGAVIVRPAVLFAPDDGFLTTILRLLRVLPAYAMAVPWSRLFGWPRACVACQILQMEGQPARPGRGQALCAEQVRALHPGLQISPVRLRPELM
jgi:hypothetical protein